jgi:phospholipid/cholesterol/gamma-HCH transport system permease protein
MSASAGNPPADPPLAEPGAFRSGFVYELGAAAIDLAYGARELYSIFVRTLYYSVRGRREPGATVRQMYEMGNKSLFFLSITMGFIGMILVLQAGIQAQRVVPDFTMLGPTYLELLVRDIAA